MAMCMDMDGGWLPCLQMLRAAAKPEEDLAVLKFDLKDINGVIRAVWDALNFILFDFQQGSDYLGVQEAFRLLCSVIPG